MSKNVKPTLTPEIAELLKQVADQRYDHLIEHRGGGLYWNFTINPDGSTRVWFEVWVGEGCTEYRQDQLLEALADFAQIPDEPEPAARHTSA